jgi:Family of unknown function (DUF5871)
MSSSNIIKIANFISEKFTIDDNSIKATKYGGKTFFVSYNKGPVRIQLPKVKAPFGIGRFQSQDGDDIKYSLDVTVTPEIMKVITDIEEKIISFAVKNSKEIFKKVLSEEVLRANFKSSLKYSMTEDGEVDTRYQPRLKTKVYNRNDELQITAYKSVKEDGKYPRIFLTSDNADEYLSKGTEVELILQASPAWVVSGNFGISWVLNQAKIHPNSNPLNSYAFDDSDDEENPAEFEHSAPEEDYAPEPPVAAPRRTREKF